MTTDRWQEVQALFAAASELEPAAQAGYLAAACAGDPALRDEVLALLRADRELDHAFLSGVVGGAVAAVVAQDDSSRLGEQVGPYRLLREAGRGGMGTVYQAERVDGEYTTQVAIKFVRGTLAAPELARRLRAERQILAGLTHPNIAWLLDGGTASDGTPYLVMEYVDGEPIDRWCDRHGVGLEGRLALFRRVCAAVQYAHQGLIIHRDLKPSNILVTRDGTPKLVDFGIARLLDGADAEVTGTMRLLTPAYAAPEQVRGGRIGVAADIYALGGVLYELLTHRTPVDLSGASMGEIERRIVELEPPLPSAAATGPAAAWRRALRGDLDTIVMKALRKEPARRYASVEQFSADLARREAGLPVLARPVTVRYRTGKFLKRNRAGVITALAVALLTAGYTVQLSRERDRARVEAEKAGQISTFLQDLFKVSDPARSRTDTITARELLDRGAARIATSLNRQPEVQATLMQVIGNVYGSLAFYREERDQSIRALALRRRLHGPIHEDVAESELSLADALLGLGEIDSAEAHAREALRIERALHPGDSEQVVFALASLAGLLKNASIKLDEAESLFREALAMRRRLGPDPGSQAMLADGLAGVLEWQGREAEAEPWFRQAVALVRQQEPVDSAILSIAIHNLALTVGHLGKTEEAAGLERQALAISLAIYQPDHPFVSAIRSGLAQTLRSQGDLAGAEEQFRLALAADSSRPVPDPIDVGNDFGMLGTTLLAAGKLDEAEWALRRALEVRRNGLGPNHPYVAISINELAGLQLARGRLAAAERGFREALALRRAHQPVNRSYVAYSLVGLARTLMAGGRPREALRLLVEADTIRRATLPEGHALRREVDSLLGVAGGE
ncbi:MAG: tetratricopeptide repeat protein [Gemmatimonadales bacterium]